MNPEELQRYEALLRDKDELERKVVALIPVAREIRKRASNIVAAGGTAQVFAGTVVRMLDAVLDEVGA